MQADLSFYNLPCAYCVECKKRKSGLEEMKMPRIWRIKWLPQFPGMPGSKVWHQALTDGNGMLQHRPHHASA